MLYFHVSQLDGVVNQWMGRNAGVHGQVFCVKPKTTNQIKIKSRIESIILSRDIVKKNLILTSHNIYFFDYIINRKCFPLLRIEPC